MRLRTGRPGLDRYASRFDVPPALEPGAGGPGGSNGGSPLTVTFLGVSSLLLTDGESALLTDGFFTRPSLATVALRRLRPDVTTVRSGLARAGIDRLDAVLPVHTHFDHALDSAVVAELTGALLAGGRSVANLGHGHDLPASRIVTVREAGTLSAGAFRVTHLESAHCPPDRFPGPIGAPLRPPARASRYRCGEAWSLLIEHAPSRRTVLVQGSAGFVPGALAGRAAEVAYLGVGQLGLMPHTYLEQYWQETVLAVGARTVVLIHWDDFFRPLSKPLRALPYAGDDLDVTMDVLAGLASRDAVRLHLPVLWRREDPWR